MASFALTFVASLILMWDGLVGWALLPIAALLLLVYPQLVFLHACLAGGGSRLAQRYLILDALLLGAWLPVVGFNLGQGYAMLAAVMLNNSITGGSRWLLASVAAFLAGALLVGGQTGFRFEPLGNLSVTVLGLVGILVYMNVVTESFRRQTVRLLAVTRENSAKRKLFEALAAAGLTASSSASLEAIVDIVLEKLASVLPPGRGVGILVRDRTRTRLLHCAAFRDIPEEEQSALLVEAGGRRGDVSGAPTGTQAATPTGASWAFVGGAGGAFEALCVVRGAPLDETQQRTVDIFMQQLDVMLENHALTTQLRALASTDGLTGIANRSRFDECLATAIDRKRRHPDIDFSLIVADINGLKQVNDGSGHEAGDRLIIAAAALLRATARETDVVARLGGDEFVVLCPATQGREAARLIDRLQQRLAAQPASTAAPVISISLGAADSSETDPGDVMNLADQRMYADKAVFHRGRAGATPAVPG